MVEIFPVLGQPAATVEPTEGAFDDPAFGQDDKALGLVGALDDFDVDLAQDFSHRSLEFGPLITAVGIELQQEREPAEQGGEQQRPAIAVLNVGGMNDRVQQQALRIYQDMALLALDFLAGVPRVAALPRPRAGSAMRIDRDPPFSAALTLWLSIIAAVGLASRPACSRHFS